MVLVSSALVTPKNRYLRHSLLCSLHDLTRCCYLWRPDSLRLTLPVTTCRLHPIRILLNNIRWSLMDNKLAGNAVKCSGQLDCGAESDSNLNLSYMLAPRYAGEQLLRQSGVSYTVVRPGGLTNAKGGEHLVIAEQGDKGSPGRISRADVAAVCVEAVVNPAAACMTLELKEDPKQAATQDNIQKIFAGLSAD